MPNEAAEQAFLGGLLNNPNEINTYAEALTEEAFSQQLHKNIWSFLRALKDPASLSPLDLTTSGIFSEAASEYILEMAEAGSLASNLPFYYSALKDALFCQKLAENEKLAASPLNLEVVKENLLKLLQEETCITNAPSVDDFVPKWWDAYEQRWDGIVPTSIISGYAAIDDNCILKEGALVVLAAQPGMGKTTLALNIAENVSRTERVYFISLEMGYEELITKLISRIGSIPLPLLINPKKAAASNEELLKAMEEARKLKLHIEQNEKVYTLSAIIQGIRSFCKKYKDCKLVVVDYILLIKAEDGYSKNRAQEVGNITTTFKRLARELNICILALSQLNRTVNENKSKMPELYHLKESSSIEQDANSVLFVHRQSVFERDDPALVFDADLIVAKCRMGTLGNSKLRFDGRHSSFTEQIFPTIKRRN